MRLSTLVKIGIAALVLVVMLGVSLHTVQAQNSPVTFFVSCRDHQYGLDMIHIGYTSSINESYATFGWYVDTANGRETVDVYGGVSGSGFPDIYATTVRNAFIISLYEGMEVTAFMYTEGWYTDISVSYGTQAVGCGEGFDVGYGVQPTAVPGPDGGLVHITIYNPPCTSNCQWEIYDPATGGWFRTEIYTPIQDEGAGPFTRLDRGAGADPDPNHYRIVPQ